MGLFEPLFDELNENGVRYVVVGGVAVVLHGYLRVTGDLDLIVDLEPGEAARAVAVLVRLGYRPRVPVDAAGFADPAVRDRWIREKGMQVFTMTDASNPLRVVDLFVDHPLPFAGLWSRSQLVAVGRSTVRIASLSDIIEMKRVAGRPQDLLDIEKLRELERLRGRDER